MEGTKKPAEAGGGPVAKLRDAAKKCRAVSWDIKAATYDKAADMVTPYEIQWQVDRAALCSLIAKIFVSGGPQASDYGNLAVAAKEAERVVSETRRLAEDDRARWQAQRERLWALEQKIRESIIGGSIPYFDLTDALAKDIASRLAAILAGNDVAGNL